MEIQKGKNTLSEIKVLTEWVDNKVEIAEESVNQKIDQ